MFLQEISEQVPERLVICSDSTRKSEVFMKVYLTGKGLSYGGSLARTEATGYGLLYLTEEMLKCNGHDIKGKTVCVSGSGNVAIYATQKAQQLGAKVVTVSDSTGWVYDPEGIDVALLKEVKEVKRARLTEYAAARPSAEYHEGRGVWSIKCDVALPCATQNELLLDDAKQLVANGCIAVAEGANMPTTLEATRVLTEEQCTLCTWKSCKRRWCCNFRIRDEPELREIKLDIRGSRCKITEYHGKYLPQLRRCCKTLQHGR